MLSLVAHTQRQNSHVMSFVADFAYRLMNMVVACRYGRLQATVFYFRYFSFQLRTAILVGYRYFNRIECYEHVLKWRIRKSITSGLVNLLQLCIIERYRFCGKNSSSMHS